MNRIAGPEQFEIVRSGRFSEKQILGSMVAVIAIVLAKLGLSGFNKKDKSSLYKFCIRKYDICIIRKCQFDRFDKE